MKQKQKPQNYVRGETNTLELANVGHAINLRVYQRGRLLGRLLVGQGGIAWLRAGKRRSQRKKIPWKVFAVMMREWPFGSPKRARIKFVDGAIRWRGPGKRGPGRKVSWDEFVRRMEAPLPEPRSTRSGKGKAGKGGRKAAATTGRKQPGGSPAVTRVSKIPGAMGRAAAIRFHAADGTEVRLRRTGTARRPGPIQVSADGRRCGEIQRDGLFMPARRQSENGRQVADALRRFDRSPRSRMREYGKETGRCSVCGRLLTNPVSVERGIGPICEGRL